MELDPRVIGFILYCARQKKGWPELYDEMCRVAGQGLYQGLRYKDLRKLGLSLSLHHLQNTIQIIEQVTECKLDNDSFDLYSQPSNPTASPTVSYPQAS